MPFVRRIYAVPAAEEESFVAELWQAGTLGVEVKPSGPDEVRLEAYFPAGRSDLSALPPALETVVPDRDWLADYRRLVQPFELGRGFLVDPREPGETLPDPAGRSLLRLPARAAFGTGSHESTALALALLEDVALRGRRLLDVGTGTGVLALAARRLGATSAVALDIDPIAVFHARDNARLNELPLTLMAGTLAALRPADPPFQVVVANLIAEQLLPELAALVAMVAPAGVVILSGILIDRAAVVLDAAREHGLVPVAERAAGEWVGLRLAASEPGGTSGR
jgi:ribosomal protein L11 methyltransferase